MAKTKADKSVKASNPSKDVQVKKNSTVKHGAVTKPSQTPKAKSQEIAKQVAVKAGKHDLKSKKAKKEPTPEPESDSESDSDEEIDSEDSESSESESDEEVDKPVPVANGNINGKTNGVAKAAVNAKDESESSESSASSDEEEESSALAEEQVSPKSVPAVAAQKAVSGESESDEDSDDSEDSDKDAPIDSKALNGALLKVANEKVSSCFQCRFGYGLLTPKCRHLQKTIPMIALNLMVKMPLILMTTLLIPIHLKMKVKKKLLQKSERPKLIHHLWRRRPKPKVVQMVSRTFSLAVCHSTSMKSGSHESLRVSENYLVSELLGTKPLTVPKGECRPDY